MRLARVSPAAGALAGGLFCLAILGGMMVFHAWPLWTGRVVVLRVTPIDPRDLFRGEFVRLSTPADRLLVTTDPEPPADGPAAVRPTGAWWDSLPAGTRDRDGMLRGEVVYVQLEPGPDGVEYRPSTISRQIVPGAVNLKGRIRSGPWPQLAVDYGLDAFYMQEGTARPVEDAVRNGRRVQMEIAIASDGRARIRNLIIDGTPLPRR